MSKIKLNFKRLIALIIAGNTMLALNACANDNSEKPEYDNKIGYSNVNPINTWGIDEENFAVLDIGDHDTVKTHFQTRKMQLCNENGICLGVIISSDAEDEASIYDDVEYAKGIVRDHSVKFPVYLNIDKIITNDNLNIEMKTKLIKNFLEKCSANNIYVGLHGTDTNLCRVKQYCGITGYDALVVKEQEEITYDGPYNVYQELDSTFIATTNLEEAILAKNLNESEGFANDGTYTISSEEELVDLALRCGMSVNEILEFNNKSRKDIAENTVLRIPSQIDTAVPQGEITYKQVDTPIRGCDMSYAQGTSADWDQMKEEFEFVILRSNIGLSEDDCFATNAQQATLTGIPIGAYCYNAYSSDDFSSSEEFIRKQEQQADFTISVLKNKKIDYPVYLDVEGLVDATTYKKEDVQAMLDIWVDKLTSSGYIPGLYCNKSTYNYLSSCVDYKLSDKLELWFAGGKQYSSTESDCSKHQHLTVDDVEPTSVLYDDEINATMAQSTNIALGPAGDHRGHLDINFSTVDYSEKQQTSTVSTTETEIKDFDSVDYMACLYGLGAVTVLAGGTVLGVKASKSRKEKQKPKIKVKNI